MIRLVRITKFNWKECIGLAVGKDQVDFVPSNLYSIAEAQFYPDAHPLAIYNERDQMVGFVLYGKDDFSDQWKIFRLMIDFAHQRKGHAILAMKQVIAELIKNHRAEEILICYHTSNSAARALYRRLGFVEVSTKDNVVTACLELNTDS